MIRKIFMPVYLILTLVGGIVGTFLLKGLLPIFSFCVGMIIGEIIGCIVVFLIYIITYFFKRSKL